MDEIALRIFPHLYDDFLGAAKLHNKFQNYEGAIRYFSKAIEIDPTNIVIRIERGKTYILVKKFEKAKNDFDTIINNISKSGYVYFWRGLSYFHLRKFIEAKSDFDISIKSEDAKEKYFDLLPLIYFLRGAANHLLDNLKDAILDYNLVIELRPNFPDFYYFRGFAHYQSNKKEQAISDWKKSILLGKDTALKLIFNI